MMRLLYSHTSPYARKVRVLIEEKGLAGRVEAVTVVTADNPPELLAANPLGLIPTLIRDDGRPLADSPVICRYLDGLTAAPRLFPDSFEAQVEVMHREALADGILDAALGMVMEQRRPAEYVYQPNLERRGAAIRRAVAAIEGEAARFTAGLDIGVIALGCALEYLDFRLPEPDWRAEAPQLAAWLAGFAARPSMERTRPKE